MELKFVIIIALAFVLLIPVNAFATQGYWVDEWGKQFSHSPTVCLFQPNDSRVDENRWKIWYTDAKTGIDTWRSILSQTGPGNWDITIVEVPLDKADLLNHSACDVSVHFVKQLYETDGNCAYALGCAWQNGLIKIVYSNFEYCGKKFFSEYGINMHTYCFSDNFARSKQMANTVQHEFGHTLGLGHYRGYDSITTQSWYDSKIGAPSIMAWIEPNEEVRQITQNDVNRILDWYSSKGFGKKTNHTPIFNERIIPEPVIGVSGTGTIHLSEGKSSTFTISGSIPDKLYKRGEYLQIIIQKPDGITKYEATSVSKTLKKFNHNLTFNSNDPTGKYKISLKFNDKVFDKKEINVIKQSATSYSTNSDKDHDGIIDSKDFCPTKPETYNGYRDTDGCPDQNQVYKKESPIFTANQKNILTQKIDSASVSILELKDGMDVTWNYIKEAEQKYTSSQSKSHVEKAWNLYNKLYNQRYNTNENLNRIVEDYLSLEDKSSSSSTDQFSMFSSRLGKIIGEVSIIGDNMKYISQELEYAAKYAHSDTSSENIQKSEPEKQCFLFWC